MIKRRSQGGNREHGFTIIELMIATMVFSSVIVLLTAGVLYFTRMYYKGITLSSTQSTARQIADNISQAIQFSGKNDLKLPANPNGSAVQVMCIGSKRYTYVLKKQVIDSGTTDATHAYHALVMDQQTSTCDQTPIVDFDKSKVGGTTNTSTIVELVNKKMRLTKLEVVDLGSNNLYKVTVGVSYGDSDLFTDSSYTKCSLTSGSQFCATSTLITTVQKRIN